MSDPGIQRLKSFGARQPKTDRDKWALPVNGWLTTSLPHAPIIVAGSYALCADDAKDVLANNDLVVADCRCPGCQRGPNG